MYTVKCSRKVGVFLKEQSLERETEEEVQQLLKELEADGVKRVRVFETKDVTAQFKNE